MIDQNQSGAAMLGLGRGLDNKKNPRDNPGIHNPTYDSPHIPPTAPTCWIENETKR